MLFMFSTPASIRYLWHLKTVAFLHWCLIRTVLLIERHLADRYLINSDFVDKYLAHFANTMFGQHSYDTIME